MWYIVIYLQPDLILTNKKKKEMRELKRGMQKDRTGGKVKNMGKVKEYLFVKNIL